jgi:HPt (histidine-containing phosphotransfer) domain-containing protein
MLGSALARAMGIADTSGLIEEDVPAEAGPLRDVDLDVLRKLYGAQRGEMAEVIEMFLDNAARQIATIDERMRAGDASYAQDVAHALKGASHSVGAHALGEAASKLELELRTGGAKPGAAEGLRVKLEAARPVLMRATEG